VSGIYTVEAIPASDLVHGDIFQDEYRTLYEFKVNNGDWVGAKMTRSGADSQFASDHEVYRLKVIELEPAEELAKQMGGVPPVYTEDPVVVLLYLLFRDHLAAGVIEGLVNEMANGLPVSLTNRYLAYYADNIARRLRAEGDNDVVSYLRQEVSAPIVRASADLSDETLRDALEIVRRLGPAYEYYGGVDVVKTAEGVRKLLERFDKEVPL
jgi:hypothetical protein